jgi:ABC-type molybdate transport system ATPase subunit
MAEGFTFGDLWYPSDGSALRGVTLQLGPAERATVFGPNGSGKTTLLRSIAGTLPGGRRRDDVAYLPQTPYLFRGTARSNLRLGRDADPPHDLAEALGVDDILDQQVTMLSGGQRQRVALARTLGGREPLVLLDEPLAPIDVVDRNAVIDAIRAATEGRALLCVTHAIDDAAAMAETIAVMDEGRVVQRGPIEEVLAMPATDRIARIVGVSNVVHGRVVSREGALATVAADGATLLVVTDAGPGRELVLRIDAATIAVQAEAGSPSSARNVINGTVRSVVPRGALVEIAMAGQLGLVALVTPGALDVLGLTSGSPVWFVVKTAAIDVIGVR